MGAYADKMTAIAEAQAMANAQQAKGYTETPYAWSAPESVTITPETTFTWFASPYNPNDTGLAPVARNERDSDAEIVKQTGGLWEKLGKISASMLSSFPGTTKFMLGAGQIPTIFVTPDVNPGSRLPSKIGGAGLVAPPPAAISPSITRGMTLDVPTNENPAGFWDTVDEQGFWKTYFNAYRKAGNESTAAGGVDFIKTAAVDKAKDAVLDVFALPKSEDPERRSGIDATLDLLKGPEGNYNIWAFAPIAAGILILIVLLK